MVADCGRYVLIESEQRATALCNRTQPNVRVPARPAAGPRGAGGMRAQQAVRPWHWAVLADVGFLQEFGSLSGARIVRIATHPDLTR